LEEHRVPRLAIWVDTGAGDEALDDACSAAASIVSSASTTGVGVRLAAASTDGPSVVSRASALALHRWLARLAASDVSLEKAIGWLAGDGVRGVGTLVVISHGEAFGPDVLAALDALARLVPRVVLVTTGEDDRDRTVAGGIQVLPWLGEDGFGGATPGEALRPSADVGARA
jgi:uncharacterized protein (DUF58 family)